jgi:hypothetical protein
VTLETTWPRFDPTATFPSYKLLKEWQLHCEELHGATSADYRRNVRKWHQENAPECEREYRATLTGKGET